jgi:hypothetical protein
LSRLRLARALFLAAVVEDRRADDDANETPVVLVHHNGDACVVYALTD